MNLRMTRLVLFLFLVFGVSFTQIEPVLQHLAQSPVFFLESNFFREFMLYPGGMVGYLAAFLQQFYLQPWWGASITTLFTGGICWAATGLWVKIGQPPSTWIQGLLVLLLLLVQTQYHYPWMELALGLLGVLVSAQIYLLACRWAPVARAGWFLLLAWPLYYVAGGIFMLFALLCGLVEMRRSQSWQVRFGLGGFYWITGAVLPFAACRYVFLVSTADAYGLWLPVFRPLKQSWAAAILLLVIPWITLALAWSKRDPARIEGAGSGTESGEQPRASGVLACLAAHPVWSVWLTAAAGLALFFAGQDRPAKMRLQIDAYAQSRQWNQVLQLSLRIKHPGPEIVHEVNRALGHTGRLPHDMFSYPQQSGWDFWLSFHDTFNPRQSLRASDLLFELGQINRAERMAGEHYELRGYHPAVLQRLALINILKDDPQVARLFLAQLANTITHRAWAQTCLQQLETDPALSQDPELERLRRFMPRRDYVGDFETEALLNQLLIQNRQNQMAFEFLMAHYLLTSQLNKAAALLSRLKDFDYQGIPRHYEEAALLYQVVHEQQPINLFGRTVRPETLADFQRFNEQLKRFGGDFRKAMETLKIEFGNTYWFYYFYGCSAVMLPYVAIQLNP